MEGQKIAVIGAGISGLGAAWALKQSGYEVTVYERENRVGGHACQVDVDIDGKIYPMDIGVGGIMDTYLNIFALCDVLEIDLPVTEWRIFVQGRDGNCWGQTTNRSILGPENRYYAELKQEARRFFREMHYLYAKNPTLELMMTVEQYCDLHGYSETFREEVLHPFISSLIETTSIRHTLDSCVAFLPEFFTIKIGDFGTGTSMFHRAFAISERIGEELKDEILLDCPVTSVERCDGYVELEDGQGRKERYDHLIFSINFDLIRGILKDITNQEKNLIGNASMRREYVVLHSDDSVLPPLRPKGDIFGFYYDRERNILTEDLGWFAYDIPDRVYRTFDDDPAFIDKIDRDKIIHTSEWDRCSPSVDSLMMQAWLHKIQGRGNVWYCGASMNVIAHELSFISGLVAASAIGAEYPFPEYSGAEQLFRKHRTAMLEGSPPNLYMLTGYE